MALRLPSRLIPPLAVGAVAGIIVRFSLDHQFEAVRGRRSASSSAPRSSRWSYLLRRAGSWRLRETDDLLRYGLVGPGRHRRRWRDRRRRGRPSSAHAATGGFAEVWGSWVIDDLFGLIVITPAIATLRRPRNWSWLRSVEYLIAVAYTAASTYYIFFVVVPGEQGLFGWPYLVVLGSIWIAVRLGVQAVAPVVALQFWAAVVATVSGLGSFAEAAPDPLDRLLAVELFSIVMASVILALGSAARRPASLAGRGRAGRPAPARGHRRVGRGDLRQELRGPRRVGHLRPGEQGRCGVRRASGRRGARTARRRAVPAGGRCPTRAQQTRLSSSRASPSPRRAGSPTRRAESGSSPTPPTR